ncbi:DUF4124 domain-containing protein [Variovorax sp. RT4R15]|uniref:DUF4124 domain-containing protein n=1 Tax=Variovorax sp. RT4R15 TaxID=3443737 RepID=UPI003F47BF8D
MRFAIYLAGLPLLLTGIVQAQPQQAAPAGIYSCIDSRGRNITSDRPIADCMDREQRELNPSGTTRRRIEPTYTAREQAERDERARQAALVALRQNEDRRRERALLMRYPNVAAHERERKDAISQIDAVIQAARKRQAELVDERKKVDDELEFYKGDASKAPASIRRQRDDNTQSVLVQNRFIGEQEDEKKRVNARFDEERARLRQLWTVDAGGLAK